MNASAGICSGIDEDPGVEVGPSSQVFAKQAPSGVGESDAERSVVCFACGDQAVVCW